jgi:iron complex transport system substrate-binding protein
MVRALEAFDRRPAVVSLTPRSLRDIEQNLRDVALAAGCPEVAETLIADCRLRVARVAERVNGVPPRRVFFVEWIDPIFCGGHWVPEIIELAGGVDALGRRGEDSVRVSLEEVIAWAPEVLVVSPCGSHLESAVDQARSLVADERWKSVPAVQSGDVYAVDASSYFARPGPRVFEGLEMLAPLIHPELFQERPERVERVIR